MLQQQQLQQPPLPQNSNTPVMVQQQQQQQHNQVVRTNQHQNDQPSPGHQFKLSEKLIDTNAFDNKHNDQTLSNNLLIMANNQSGDNDKMHNDHKDFSCSVGDESVCPTSNNNTQSVVVDIIPNESNDAFKMQSNDSVDNVLLKSATSVDVAEKDGSPSTGKNANLSIANNIANAFINLSSGKPTSPSVVQATNVNVIVTQQPIAQHFMKTLSFTTSRGGIFVPNVIATNITPQFTVHQFGLHGNHSGPAPNVTVNPNGNFNTGSSSAPRLGAPNHFRLLFQQSPSVNFNIIGNQATLSNATNSSPILEASLQTINKVAANQQQSTKVIPSKTIMSNAITSKIAQQTVLDDTETTNSSGELPLDSTNIHSNDQHIRVLTPSEIMKTLPSLSTPDNVCFNTKSLLITDKNLNAIETKCPIKSQQLPSSAQCSQASGSITNNSTSPITNFTSECNTFNSSNKSTPPPTTSSTNAQMQMVSGYKTYKKY